MRAFFLAILALILAACASPDLRPVERVDPDTAIHVTIMAEPWLYILDDPPQGANATHFMNVAVVEANRTGTRSYWLNVVSWNTSARGKDAGDRVIPRPAEVRLRWPTKLVQLASVAEGRSAAGISEPAIAVPGTRIGDAWCPLSAEQIAELGASAPTGISVVDQEGRAQSYAAWQVDVTAVKEFLKATGKGND